MVREIEEYLKSARPDFDQGLALFCKYGRNQTAMAWISRRHDFPKLLYELRKLAGGPPSINPASGAAIARYGRNTAVPERSGAPRTEPVQRREIVVRTYDERRTRRADLPPELQSLYDRISEDYKLRRGLHEKMKMAATDKDRASFRARVVEIEERIRDGWKVIDDFFSSPPAVPVQPPFSESTYRSYVSRCMSREKNSPVQVATCRERVRALLEHGCRLDDSTLATLKTRGLADE